METMQASIISEIQAVCTDIKKDLTDINQKLSTMGTDLKEITTRTEETQQRVAEVEEFCTKARAVISHLLGIQDIFQARLSELEGHSRRNNIHIHRIPEGTEGDNMQAFLENFIKTELSLLDTSLCIQRCHCSRPTKPPQGSNPRSIIIHFLEYKTKELVLRSACKKKEVHYEGKPVFFEKDYLIEILVKRQAYSSYRKMLKGKGARFQMLYSAKLRVFYDSSTVTYNDAPEGDDDMKKRGLLESGPETPANHPPPIKRRQPTWETAGPCKNHGARLKYIQNTLKDFRRDEETK